MRVKLSVVIPAVFFLMAMMAAPGLAQNETSPYADVEKVARDYFETFKNADWTGNAALMHPEELAGFRDLMVPLFEKVDASEAGAEFIQFFGVESVEALSKASPEEFFATFLGTFMSIPELSTVFEGAEMKVLGVVPEGSDTAHAVYRMSLTILQAGTPITTVEVVSFRKYEGQWRACMTADIKELVNSIEQMLNEIAP